MEKSIADMTLDELHAEKERMEADENGFDANEYNQIVKRISDLESDQEQNKRHEERVQAQEEKLAAIKLPYDFNALFDNKSANDIIVEVVQQFQRQAHQEHNAEIALLETSYKDKLRAADDREAQLQRQNADLQKQSQAQVDEIADLKRSELQALAEAAEAKRGRDLLAQENESLKAELAQEQAKNADLQKQLEAAKQPQKQTEIQGNDRLNALISTAEKAKKASDAFFLRHPDLAPPELKQPEPPAAKESPFRTETEQNPDAQSESDQLHPAEAPQSVEQFPDAQNDAVQSTAAVDQSAGQADQGTISREEWNAIVRRVERLEEKVNLPGVA